MFCRIKSNDYVIYRIPLFCDEIVLTAFAARSSVRGRESSRFGEEFDTLGVFSRKDTKNNSIFMYAYIRCNKNMNIVIKDFVCDECVKSEEPRAYFSRYQIQAKRL